MAKWWKKYRDIVSYLFFGVCTTAVNILVYDICYLASGIGNVPSTVVAWLVSVLFAFVTNKLWVFQSKTRQAKALLHEVLSFFGCRLATGVLDVVIMYLAVDCMGGNGLVWKLISNVLVIVLNYAASKFWIFRK